jgi:hypothetical protein
MDRFRGTHWAVAYCDVIIRRWQILTGKQARHAFSDDDFEPIEVERARQYADTCWDGVQ